MSRRPESASGPAGGRGRAGICTGKREAKRRGEERRRGSQRPSPGAEGSRSSSNANKRRPGGREDSACHHGAGQPLAEGKRIILDAKNRRQEKGREGKRSREQAGSKMRGREKKTSRDTRRKRRSCHGSRGPPKRPHPSSSHGSVRRCVGCRLREDVLLLSHQYGARS